MDPRADIQTAVGEALSTHQIQINHDGSTLWVHAIDGSTVGRFSKRFGLDVHTSATEQLNGADQCLHCTHVPASPSDWQLFRKLMLEHYGVHLDSTLVTFT